MDVTSAIWVTSITDVGLVREQNEDAVASDLTTGLVMVADGMGGYKGGKIASEIAVIVMTAELVDLMGKAKQAEGTVAGMLSSAVAKANTTIFNAAQIHASFEGMGATFVAGVFVDNKIIVGHVGDSRLYRMREEVLEQLTEDHSVLQEQINAGLITKEQAKSAGNGHLVTRALGADQEVELTLNEYAVEVGDLYLLCSDGLTDLVSDDAVKSVLLESKDNIDIAAQRLVELAIKEGGNDNISIVIAFVQNAFAQKRGLIRRLLG